MIAATISNTISVNLASLFAFMMHFCKPLPVLPLRRVECIKVKAITEELGGHTFSASTVSRINQATVFATHQGSMKGQECGGTQADGDLLDPSWTQKQ